MENVKCPPSPLNAIGYHFGITVLDMRHGIMEHARLTIVRGETAPRHTQTALTDGAGTHRYAVAGLDPNEPLVVGLSFGAFMSVATPESDSGLQRD